MSEGNRTPYRTQHQTQWGWHSLASHYAEDLVHLANIGPDDLVLDIGAGTGALTTPLAASGARVIAIELHEQRVARLRRKFASNKRVKVVRSNAGDLWLPRQPFRVVANPPFAITSTLLHRLLGKNTQLVSAHLVMQRAAARRFAVGFVHPTHKSSYGFNLSIARLLPRSAFHPPPHVDIAVLLIQRVQIPTSRKANK